MKRSKFLTFMGLLLALIAAAWGFDQCWAEQSDGSAPEIQQNLTTQDNAAAQEKTAWEVLEQSAAERAEVDPLFRKYVDYYNARMKALHEGTLISR